MDVSTRFAGRKHTRNDAALPPRDAEASSSQSPSVPDPAESEAPLSKRVRSGRKAKPNVYKKALQEAASKRAERDRLRQQQEEERQRQQAERTQKVTKRKAEVRKRRVY